MGMFTKIVTAVDLSEISPDLMRYAARIAATAPGAQLHVLHVVPDPLKQPWSVEAAGVDFAQLVEDWVAEATRRVNALITAEGRIAADVVPIVLVGKTAETIVRYANDIDADAIVLGTHGYGPVRRFMLGSTAERVLRQTTCPVLTIPHSGLKTLAHGADAVTTPGA